MAAQTIDFSDLGGKPVQPQGRIDFSDLGGKQISAAPPQTQAPTATISAMPQPQGVGASIANAMSDFAGDLRYGSNTTLAGRALHAVGMQPLSAGQGEQVGDFMGSLPLGASRAVQGGGELATPGQRWQGTKDVVGGTLQAATIPSAFVAPEGADMAANGVGSAVDRVAGMIPSTERAKQMFGSVAADANKIPVKLDNAGDGALKLMDWQTRTQLGPTINKFLNRITNPNLGPMTYEEARKEYQLLGDLSANEKITLAPAVKRDLVQMLVGFKQDIGNAAAQVGRSDDYYSAMNQFRQASRLNDAKQAVADKVVPPMVKGAAGALGAGSLYGLWRLLSGK